MQTDHCWIQNELVGVKATDPDDPQLSIGPGNSGGENERHVEKSEDALLCGDPNRYKNHQLCLLFYTATNFGIEVISVVKSVV